MSKPDLTFAAFRRANVARCLKWHPAGIDSWSPSDWLTAATGELGELASLLKMRNRERDGLPGNKFSPTDKMVADELADVLTYLDLLAEVLGVDLGAAAVSKFNEVSERVGFPDRIDLAALSEQRAEPAPQPSPGSGEAQLMAEAADCLAWYYEHPSADDATGFQQKRAASLARKIRAALAAKPVSDAQSKSSATVIDSDGVAHEWKRGEPFPSAAVIRHDVEPVSDAQDGREAETVGADFDGYSLANWRIAGEQLVLSGSELVRAAFNEQPPPSASKLGWWMQDAMRVMRGLSALAAAPQAAPGQPVAWVVDANEGHEFVKTPNWVQVHDGDPMWSDNWQRYGVYPAPQAAPGSVPEDGGRGLLEWQARSVHVSTAERDANARLIAAAPDLLLAVEDLLAGWKYIRSFHGDLYGVGWDRAQDKAEAAMLKATGTKP